MTQAEITKANLLVKRKEEAQTALSRITDAQKYFLRILDADGNYVNAELPSEQTDKIVDLATEYYGSLLETYEAVLAAIGSCDCEECKKTADNETQEGDSQDGTPQT